MLKNTKGIIKNRQSRNTGNIGHTIHMPKTNKTHTYTKTTKHIHTQKQHNTHIHKNNTTQHNTTQKTKTMSNI